MATGTRLQESDAWVWVLVWVSGGVGVGVGLVSYGGWRTNGRVQ